MVSLSEIALEVSEECVGCGVCAVVCPNVCISMVADSEGFLYPRVVDEQCIHCGLCSKACPVISTPMIKDQLGVPKVHAAWHLDPEIREKSSSGGVFTALAHHILTGGGVVVGAAFDESLVVRHTIVSKIEDLEQLRGAKYVQSKTSTAVFKSIREYLEHKKQVLYSGTPCQIAGLRNFLRKGYDNLLCCDLICHGVPSPGWFEKYVDELSRGNRRLIALDFRNKEKGWTNYRIKKTWEDGKTHSVIFNADTYMLSFLKNYSLRPSCYACKFATIPRVGDITLGDYWQVETKYPEYDLGNKGTSLVLVNTEKGQAYWKSCSGELFFGEGDLEHAISGNLALKQSVAKPLKRATFYEDVRQHPVRILRRKYQLYPAKFWTRMWKLMRRAVCVKGSKK